MSVRVAVLCLVVASYAVPTWAQTEADGHLVAAKIAYNAAQFRAADDHVARALALAPADPDVLAMQALVASRLGDEATAIASARRAIELGASGPVEAELAALEAAAAGRQRAAQRGTKLPRRSAPAFVDGLIEGLAAGRSVKALVEAFDPAVWMHASDPSREGFARVLAHEIATSHPIGPLGQLVYLGWIVAPEARENFDGGVWVHVDASVAFVVNDAARDAFEAALDGDADAKALVDGGLIVPLRNIPYPEREPVLDALVGTRQLNKLGFEVEVTASRSRSPAVPARGGSRTSCSRTASVFAATMCSTRRWRVARRRRARVDRGRASGSPRWSRAQPLSLPCSICFASAADLIFIHAVSVRVVPWIVILVCMFESTVLADDDRRAREVASAIEVGAYGEAYRLATELVAERPEDARAHELASAAAIETYRYVEARRHLDKALVLRPGDTRLLGQRAALRLGLADEAGARADAELAVVTDAREVVARGVLDELMLTDRARERLAGADPRLETGSPAAFVDALCAAFARRDIDGVAGSFDPSFLDDLAAQLSPAQRATSPDPLRSFAEGIFDFAANAAANGQQFFGWWVVPEAKVEGDVTWIDVQLPSEVTYTANSVAMFAAAAADPTARESVEATMRARYDGVAPEERPAMLERMVGLRVRNLVDVRFAVRRTGDVWKVTDVVANGVSMKRLSGNAVRIAAAATPATSPTTRVGRDAARVLGILALGVAALIAFFYYARRRDAAERRWRRERARR